MKMVSRSIISTVCYPSTKRLKYSNYTVNPGQTRMFYKAGQTQMTRGKCDPDDTTRFQPWTMQLGRRDIIYVNGRIELQADNTELVCSTGANVSVMVLQGCKSSFQKSKPFKSGHSRHGVWVAIEYSYKLG